MTVTPLAAGGHSIVVSEVVVPVPVTVDEPVHTCRGVSTLNPPGLSSSSPCSSIRVNSSFSLNIDMSTIRPKP